MKIAIGSDHRGYELKNSIAEYLRRAGYEVMDMGTDSPESADYPVYAGKVAKEIGTRAEKGILLCGSGIGVSIAANKFRGIRAALVREPEEARMAVEHDDANVLCMGADRMNESRAVEITENFLNARFEGGRHQRRVDMIKEFEK